MLRPNVNRGGGNACESLSGKSLSFKSHHKTWGVNAREMAFCGMLAAYGASCGAPRVALAARADPGLCCATPSAYGIPP